jgi:Sec-independent protein translocase protein TatA
MMGDVAKGLKSFKKGISEDEEATAAKAEQQRRLKDQSVVDAGPPPERVRDPETEERREP